ncbi:magnetosome biogenesis CDF transporter MamM [bacterium]|nr:magnetosome biogenesis CDF transporter MamM [bacterium]
MHELSQCNIDNKTCLECESKAGWIAVGGNLSLAVFKLIVGILSGSKAVQADSIYSFKDFLTSLIVLIGMKISGKPADESHPYGHGKIEFVAIFMISLLIIVGTVFLLIHSLKDVWMAYNDINISPPKFIAFWAAVISIIANYKLSTYLHCVGELRKSPSILANAKHNHSDAISSSFVAGAIIGTRFGLHWLDPLVAVVETIDLIRLSAIMMNDAIKGMMDTSLRNDMVEEIEKTALIVPGVKRISNLMARMVGQGIWVTMTIKVQYDITLEQSNKIGRQVEETLKKKYSRIEGINLSIEPNMIK